MDFLTETQWPPMYDHQHTRWEEYAYDIPRRAAWKTATRQEWAALVHTKIAKTLLRHMPTLTALLEDTLGQTATLWQ